MDKFQQLEVISPIQYWENEFQNTWKNGKKPNQHFLNFLKDHRHEIGPEILDVGSGDGRHVLIMAQLNYQVTGLELTATGIKTTQNRLQKSNLSAEIIKGSFHNIPFVDESFDTIISCQALHYNNWAGAITSFQEISRVLKTNGLFFFRARSERGHWRQTDQQIPDKGITRIESRRTGFTVMVHDYTLDELKYLSQQNGLEIIGEPIDEDINGQPGQWNVIFRKTN